MKKNTEKSIQCLCLLILFCLAISAEAQVKKNITGRVIDALGAPIVGAAIQEKGTSNGTTSNMDGSFFLSAKNENPVLIFSFIGMKRQELQWKGKPLTVKMEDDMQTIDEVVVTGYETIDRRRSTASISSVKMDDVLMPEMTTIDQVLEGNIPDLLFTQNSGEVGATARLRVRGTSTLLGNREPLWVLDGFPLSDPVDVSPEQLNDPDYINYIGNAIQGINPQDIERIDVLKDAAATALYGTRASNGVIVITTKKGQSGPPQIRYSNQTSIRFRPRYSNRNINLMNSQERVQFGKDLCDLHYIFPKNMPLVGYEGAYHRFQTGATSYDEFLDEVRQYETVNTDWFDLLTQDAVTQQHTVSLSGGSDKTRYYASLGYTDENGTVKTEYVNRYTASFNLNTTLSKKLSANFRFNGNVQKKNHLPSNVKALDYAYESSRAIPAYNADGTYWYYQNHAYSIGQASRPSDMYNYNILNEIDNTSSDYSGNTVSASMDFIYKPVDFLRLTLAANYSRSSTMQSTWYGESTNYVAILKDAEVLDMPEAGEKSQCELPYGGVYNTSSNFNDNFTARAQANLNKYFGADQQHLITASLGYEVNTVRTNGINDETRGYYKNRGMKYVTMDSEELDKYPLYKTWLAQGHRRITAGKGNSISGYITFYYDFKKYFSIGMNGRFDASNKFGSRSNEKFLPTWSTSGQWNIKETFLKDIKWVNEVKLRLSYGKTGNMLDNQTPNMLISQGTMDAYYGENISNVANFPNPNLRWEQTGTTNIGLDFTLFDNRLTVSSELWFKHTTDAFASINVSSVNGITSYQMNNGDLDNKGYSIYLSGYPIRTKDWKLYLSTGYSWVSNTVKTNTNQTYQVGDYLNGTAIIDGQSVGTFYSYHYLGLNPTTGIPMFDDYEDRKHLLERKTLAEIVPLVMRESGNRDPKLTGNLQATLTWKQLSLRMNFNYRIGSKVRLFNLYTPVLRGISSDKNVRKEFLNRWTMPGDEKFTDIPALISPSDPNYETTMNHWCNEVGSAQVGKIPSFASSVWAMYDASDLRVVPGDYLKLSTMALYYRFTSKQLKKTFLKSLTLNMSMANVFTIASGKLDGQDPTQAGFASVNLSTRPQLTFGLNVSF